MGDPLGAPSRPIGSFVFAGLLEGVAEDLSVSVATAGHLVTVFALSLNASATRGSRRRGSPEPTRRW